MTKRMARFPFLIAVPFLFVACGPGSPAPQGGVASSAVSFGGTTFQEPPGSVLGCQVAFCMEGVGCHACAAPVDGCVPYVGCVAPGSTEMGAGELCSQDGCLPSGCFPAYCTADGTCTVCDDGDASTVDQCFEDPANPCRHVPVDGPDAGPAVDAGGPGTVDAVTGTDVPALPDVPAVDDVPAAGDATPATDVGQPPDAGAPDVAAPPDAPGPGDDCVEACRQECQGDDDGVCLKDKHGGVEHSLLPPGWRHGKHLRCDNGKHKGFEKGHHAGWWKGKHKGWKPRHDDGDREDDDGPSCEETCLKTCAGVPDDEGGHEVDDDHDGSDGKPCGGDRDREGHDGDGHDGDGHDGDGHDGEEDRS